METFKSEKAVIDPEATIHVALLDNDGTPIIHEELPVADAPHRHHMLTLQAELDVRDSPDAERKVYMGPAWPPEGYEMKKGKIIEMAAEGS